MALSLLRRAPAPFTGAKRTCVAAPRPSVAAKAYLEVSTGFAVLQQSIAFAVVAAGEGVFTRCTRGRS